MNAPRDMGPDFRSWMHDTPAMPTDLPRRTLDKTLRTRQRRRWLWFLPDPRPTAGAEERVAPAAPPAIPIADIGGTTMMINPTKLVATAAVAALMAAMLLTGALTTQPATPAALDTAGSDAPGVITAVSGTMLVLGPLRAGDVESYEGGSASIDEWWKTEYRVDDERLNGEAISRHNRNVGAARSAYGGTRMITVRLDNDGGTWVGTGRAYSDPDGGIHYQMQLEGEGGYEGLDAILALDTAAPTVPFEVTGAIVSSGLPELPEPVSVE